MLSSRSHKGQESTSYDYSVISSMSPTQGTAGSGVGPGTKEAVPRPGCRRPPAVGCGLPNLFPPINILPVLDGLLVMPQPSLVGGQCSMLTPNPASEEGVRVRVGAGRESVGTAALTSVSNYVLLDFSFIHPV